MSASTLTAVVATSNSADPHPVVATATDSKSPKSPPSPRLKTLTDRRPLLYTFIRATQALCAGVAIISFSYFKHGYTGGNGFLYTNAISHSIICVVLLLINLFASSSRIPKMHLIILIIDSAYTCTWIGDVTIVHYILNWCDGWGIKYTRYGYDDLDCTSIRKATAFGFLALFSTMFAVVLDMLPVLAGLPITLFLRSRDGNGYAFQNLPDEA